VPNDKWAALDKRGNAPSYREPMDANFRNIAGVITDGSGPLDGAGLARVIASGASGSAMSLGSGDEFALAGLNPETSEPDTTANGAPANFFLAGGAAAGPFAQWGTTGSVSQFGEAGMGAWAAARAFPEAQKFWLARDQFGQQPLYYAEKGATTAFASNLNWFFESDFLRPELNAESFAELVQLQFLSGNSSAFNGIRRVFPGETLVIERGRVVDHLRRPMVPHSDRTLVDRAVAFDALDEVLNDVVEKALADVRVIGCVLTGDLASTALAVAIARRATRRVRAYIPIAGGEGKPTQEVAIAFAKSLGFEVVPLTIDSDTFFDVLPGIGKVMADPVGDHAAWAWDAVARAAHHDGATLVLPTGGQELFGAYGRYRTAARPLWLGGRAMRGRGHLQGLKGLPDGPSHWRDGLTGIENRLRGGKFTGIQMMQLLDIATWLPNDTLLGEHQIFSRLGVEARRPFLDPALAGLAFSLADQLKVRGQSGGVLLRHWLFKSFPTSRSIIETERPTLPLGNWMAERAKSFAPAVARIISQTGQMNEPQVRAIFEATAVKKSKRLGMAAWQLLYFALWYRLHIDGVDGDMDTVLGNDA